MALVVFEFYTISCKYIDYYKLSDLKADGDRTIIKYLHKNIPYSCLKSRFLEVKMEPKVSTCFNSRKTMKISRLMSFENCRIVPNCSRKC